MSEGTTVRYHGYVSGRVQGVGFRYFTQQIANQLGLVGWVKNTFDGKVELVVEGTPEQLQIFKRYLTRGPSSASVQDVKIMELTASGEFHSFHIRF